MKKTALLAFLAALAGCSSSPEKKPQDQPPARVEQAPSKAAPAAAEKPAPAAEGDKIEITIKKGDKRTAEAAFTDKAPPPGYVSFDFQNVDLATVALPLFSKQAGVICEYSGKFARKVPSLRLHQPVPWRDALGLICQQTQTHVLRSQIPGRLELKEGYADPTALLAKFDPNDKSGNQAGQGAVDASGGVTNAGGTGGSSGSSAGSSGSSGSSAGASGSSGGQAFDSSDYQQPKQPGADRIDELRRGVTTTNSGVK